MGAGGGREGVVNWAYDGVGAWGYIHGTQGQSSWSNRWVPVATEAREEAWPGPEGFNARLQNLPKLHLCSLPSEMPCPSLHPIKP